MGRNRRDIHMSAKDHCGLDKDAFEMVVVKNGDWELLK